MSQDPGTFTRHLLLLKISKTLQFEKASTFFDLKFSCKICRTQFSSSLMVSANCRNTRHFFLIKIWCRYLFCFWYGRSSSTRSTHLHLKCLSTNFGVLIQVNDRNKGSTICCVTFMNVLVVCSLRKLTILSEVSLY